MSPPDRVRVTGPPNSAGRPVRRTPASEIDAQSELGELYIRSLMRSQLRLALGVVAGLALTLGALPVLFVTLPALRSTRLWGIPLPWLLLGGAAYPFLVALAWFYVRRAERNEHAFDDMVGPR